MAFSAKLSLGGKEFDVLSCSYSIERSTDTKGRPSSNLLGSKITIKVESTQDTSILESMCTLSATSGSVIFRKDNEDAKLKDLKWESGYIVSYVESLEASDKEPMSILFTVSAKVVKVGNAECNQDWPE